MWSIFWLCLGMLLMFSVFAAFIAYTTGNIAVPGTSRSAALRAKNDAKIAQWEAQAQEHRFQAAQMNVNRRVMLEKADLEIDRIQNQRLALGKGEEE